MLKVKVKDVDTSRLGSGGRTLSVKPKRGDSFLTPTRPYSKPEFTAKSYLGFRGTLDGYLGAIQIDIRGNRYEKFKRRNGTVRRIRGR